MFTNRLSRAFGIVLFTLSPPVLDDIAEHENGGASLLPNHSPEILTGTLQRTLQSPRYCHTEDKKRKFKETKLMS